MNSESESLSSFLYELWSKIMPTYAYHCENCNVHHEISQKITDEPIKQCPACQKNSLRRGPGGGIGLAFKGSGFYVNDYAKSNQASAPSSQVPNSCCPCGKNQCS